MEARSVRQHFAPRSPRTLRSPRETIDLLSRSRQAAFGIDSTERIVYWNRPCEALLGYPAQKVLGKHCFEVIAGRDENGNRYCSRNCPISQQARTDDPIHPFTLTIHDASGRKLAIRFRTFAVPAVRPELSVVVHVIAEKSAELSATDRELAALAASAPPARWRMQNGAPAVGLTTREKEIILGFAEGLSTARVAERLCIAPVTVRNHTQRILLKLDVHSKLAAVVYAYRHQLL
jgi:PAS domain S-box-containing protein